MPLTRLELADLLRRDGNLLKALVHLENVAVDELDVVALGGNTKDGGFNRGCGRCLVETGGGLKTPRHLQAVLRGARYFLDEIEKAAELAPEQVKRR